MWELIRANRRRSVVLVTAMALLLIAMGYAIGELLLGAGAGPFGVAIAVVIWVVMTLSSYFAGHKILLASSRARRIEKSDHPVLWNVVEELCIAAGLSTIPGIYIIDEDAPNAFAAGRDPQHAVVVVTAGLLERLSRDELQGVIAHELAHVKHRDVLYMTMVGVMLGTVVILADFGSRWLFWGGGRRRTSADRGGGAQVALIAVALLLVILAPVLARLMYFALSRKREYLADAGAALFTRYPDGLAGALEKIAGAGLALESANRVTAPMYIVNPLAAKGRARSLLRTHPPTEERVRILRSLAGGQLSYQLYEQALRGVTGRAVGLVPAGSRQAVETVAARVGSAHDPQGRLGRVRGVTEMLWRMQQFMFIGCACGTSLKVPPVYAGREIPCPHCGATHLAIPAPAGSEPAGPGPADPAADAAG